MFKTVVTAVALALTLPAAAHALTVTVTGDNGQPLAINPAAPTTIRNMDVQAVTTVAEGDAARFKTQVLGPTGRPRRPPARA